MPPPAMAKGTGKKASGVVAAMRGKDHPRSRNATPNPSAPPTSSAIAAPPPPPPSARLPPIETVDTDYLEIRVEQFRDLTVDDLVDQPGHPAAVIPDSRSVDALIVRLQRLHETIERRNMFFDRGMRMLVQSRKNRTAGLDADVPARKDDPEDGRAAKADKADKRAKFKKRKADALAPGDAGLDKTSPAPDSGHPSKRSRDRDRHSASSSLSPVEPASPSAMDVDDKDKAKDKVPERKPEVKDQDEDEDEDEDEELDDDDAAPPQRQEAPQTQTFGEDPSTFPDPTVYEIREALPGMTHEELLDVYAVVSYPPGDLRDLIAGDPPDKDFTAGKVTNQIAFNTFSSYLEPYFRPYGEEDLAFLRERGDRIAPFAFPKRGRHYTETWAEEDGAMAVDSPPIHDRLPPNQPRGSIEHMDDDVAETDKLSIGPLLSRFLQAMRPESRATPTDNRPATNGDVSMTNGEDATDAAPPPASPDNPPAACLMAESSTEPWKKATHPKLDYHQVDERVKQELRHIGFLPQDSFDADYDGHFDDEVSARLRLLQTRLREQILVNGARKARLADIVRERMAFQEYQTILEDLDSQVQGAYLKRTRTMGKSKKVKRPGASAAAAAGGAGGGSGVARQGIGDQIKTLMERRRRWIDTIGSVFDDPTLSKVPRSEDPGSSIFMSDIMAELIKKEKQLWEDEVDEQEEEEEEEA